MDNMANIIKKHSTKVINNVSEEHEDGCNCRKNDKCPLDNKCLMTNVIYKTCVKSEDHPNPKVCIGLQKAPLRKDSTSTSCLLRPKLRKKHRTFKVQLELKDRKKEFDIRWSIITRASPYNSSSKRCDLCLTEKLDIIKASKSMILNKGSELISKCRHENKFYIKNCRAISQWPAKRT